MNFKIPDLWLGIFCFKNFLRKDCTFYHGIAADSNF